MHIISSIVKATLYLTVYYCEKNNHSFLHNVHFAQLFGLELGKKYNPKQIDHNYLKLIDLFQLNFLIN